MSIDQLPLSPSACTARPKIVLAYANTGGGHLSAARAIARAIELRAPDQYDVTLLNIAVASGSRHVTMLYETYNLMLKADPRYAKQGMRLLNSMNIERALIPVLPRAFRRIQQSLERETPSVIVSVHPIINHALLKARRDAGLTDVPYLIVCTDLTNHFLRGWANPTADHLFVFSELARRQMLDFGVTAEQLDVIRGFTVNPDFFLQTYTRAEARTSLGLQQDAFVVLISMGGMAVPRKTQAVVSALASSGLPLELVVVCGMNKGLQRRMERFAERAPLPMQVYGFTQEIPRMMSAADLMISKPGPGTIMEALIKELPLLLDAVTDPMPQERGNLEFALAEGIAQQITSYATLPAVVAGLMQRSPAYRAMQARMHALKNEEAIFQLAERILAYVPTPAGVVGERIGV